MHRMETDAVPIASGWLERLFEEARTPRGLWRKGPSQLPLQHPAYLGVVGPHLYHMNAVGFYRIGGTLTASLAHGNEIY